MCIATATSSHWAARKSSPRHTAGANPIECSTPSTRPHFSASASRTATRCSGTVTSSSYTSMPSPSLRAVRSVSESARPAPVSTMSAPSCWASLRHAEGERRVGEDAGDHDVLAVEQTHGSDRSHRADAVDDSAVPWGPCAGVPRCRHAHRHSGRNRSSGQRPGGPTRVHRLSDGHRVTVEVPGDGGPRRAGRQVAQLGRPASKPATTPTPPDCDVVVIATPWDSAAGTAQENEEALEGKVVISMANALVRVGKEFQPLVPPRAAWRRTCRPPCPKCRVVGRVPPPAGHRARPHRRADRLRRADLRRRPEAVQTVSEIVADSPAAGRSMPASCRTPRPSRRSPRCCCSSTCATRRGWRRSSRESSATPAR